VVLASFEILYSSLAPWAYDLGYLRGGLISTQMGAIVGLNGPNPAKSTKNHT